jgi:ribonuclease HI
MTTWAEIPQIELYSDGGAEPNPGKGGFGVIPSSKEKRKQFFQGYELYGLTDEEIKIVEGSI